MGDNEPSAVDGSDSSGRIEPDRERTERGRRRGDRLRASPNPTQMSEWRSVVRGSVGGVHQSDSESAAGHSCSESWTSWVQQYRIRHRHRYRVSGTQLLHPPPHSSLWARCLCSLRYRLNNEKLHLKFYTHKRL